MDQAVHFVLSCLARCKGGEIFVPRIPSMRITDLAKAIAPECKQEEVGTRPGEKINEVLISEDEARNAIQFKECFIVQNNVQLRNGLLSHLGKDKGQSCQEGFKYTSDTNTEWMSIEDLKGLVGKIVDDYSIETSRWSMSDVPE